MGFEFNPRTQINICGHDYETDVGDVEFVSGLAHEFPKILQKQQTFAQLSEALGVPGSEPGELMERAAAESAELCALAQGFIIKALGAPAYEEIFGGRRQNSAEHVYLCAYIYEAVLSAREEVLAPYIIPQNRGDRRAPTKAATVSVARKKRSKN